jgi:myo-inositol 2-dehydrogenase/D-chiro-inositol 1-dehydrogenase
LATSTPIHVGFQRRFDAGYQRVAQAVSDGELGFVHSVRAGTHDQAPPHASYVPTSGGLFRDCSIHDFDIVRFVTGREVRSAYAVGANKGADFFAEAGDVDTAAAILTLDDDTLVSVTATRYSGAGHDVRMEVIGSEGTLGVGYDDSLTVTSAEKGVDFPKGPRHWSFMERFLPAYRAELTAFAEVVAGERATPCTVDDALQAFRIAEACELSRAERRPVDLTEIKGA